MKKSVFAAFTALVAAASLAACGASSTPDATTSAATTAAATEAAETSAAASGNFRTLDEIKQSGTVKIGVFSDKAPFGYVDDKGEYQGYDVYYAHRIADDLGVNVEFTSLDPASRVEYVATGKVDIILANFTGTSGDVDVVTHEAGHALNAYLIADNRFALELGCGGMETAETHSMSMEFFAWPYLDAFFPKAGDAERYRFQHALDALSFLPYGTMVDEFQHRVYAEPGLTPAERNAVWLELEAKYRPYIDQSGIPYLERGTRWQYQMHIYETPFYYIDYCLAQTAAFQFLLASQDDYDDAFARYLHLSQQGGEKLWTDLLAEAGFRSPFEPGALAQLAARVEPLIRKHTV